MSNTFGNTDTRLLERFEETLISFFDKHKDFYGELVKIIYKYTDDRFRYFDNFSYNYRLLFRLMTDRLRDNDIVNNTTKIKEMEKDIEYLYDNFKDAYDEFVSIIKRHVDYDSNGYTWAVRIMFGFSVEEALKGTNYLYRKRKIILFELLDMIQQDIGINSNDIGNIFSIVHKNVNNLDELLQKVFEIERTIFPSKQKNINKLIEYIKRLEIIHRIEELEKLLNTGL